MINKELVAASSKPLILSILTTGESYGYEIIQKVKKLSGGELEYKDGMLYPVLHKLERDRLIESRWGKSPAGRKRKYYQLQTKGKEALKQEKEQWQKINHTLNAAWGGI